MFCLLENIYDDYVISNDNLNLEKAFIWKLVGVLKKSLAIQISVLEKIISKRLLYSKLIQKH